MSTAIEEYKKSVKQEAIEEYKQSIKDERDIQIVTNMLKKKCSLAMIEDILQIPLDKILQIAKANNIPLP